MNFTKRHLDHTKIYHYQFRIIEDFWLEQFVTLIQHKQIGDTPFGLRDFWEPVLINGNPIRVYEFSHDYSVIMVLVKGIGGYRNVLCNGNFSVDDDGLLLGGLTMFDGQNTIKGTGYIMLGQSCLAVLP
ncbi:MAG: hypothetical protein WC087_02100 [Candidatus Paceibacterota bacterium]